MRSFLFSSGINILVTLGEAKMPVLTLPQFKRLMEVTGKSVDELIEIFSESGGRPDGRSQDGVRLKRLK